MSPTKTVNIYVSSEPKSDQLLKSIAILVFDAVDLENRTSEINEFIRRKSQIQTARIFVAVLGTTQKLPADLIETSVSELARLDLGVDVLVYDDGVSPLKSLPTSFIYHLAELRLVSASSFDLEGNTRPYARDAGGSHNALFLFPGTIYPVNMGAHRRALNMLAALVDHGFNITIVYTGPGRKKRLEAAPFLSLLATGLEPFSNKQNPTVRMTVRTRKALNNLACKLRGRKPDAAESFFDRARLRNNKHLKRALSKLDVNRFDALIVNYAWMLPGVLSQKIDGPLVICDTHDVQYFRALSMKGDGTASTASMRRSKTMELALLNRADYVLAISERDGDLLRADLPAEKVLTAPSSYRYCFLEAKKPRPSRPMVFGFLGHNMPANVVALELVLNEWWPVISKYSPASRIVVAGSVCSAPSIRKIAFLNETIELAGYVKTVVGFFEGIDVLLSPVLVAGGMNFKNAEAIVAGVSLITNPLGAEALGDDNLHVADSPRDVIEHLKEIELEPEAELSRLSLIHI